MNDQKQLKIRFETVNIGELWRYSNADPRWYSNTTQTVPNSQIPDEHWHAVEKIDDAAQVMKQAANLREWIADDREFVRNLTVSEIEIAETPIDLDEALGVRHVD